MICQPQMDTGHTSKLKNQIWYFVIYLSIQIILVLDKPCNQETCFDCQFAVCLNINLLSAGHYSDLGYKRDISFHKSDQNSFLNVPIEQGYKTQNPGSNVLYQYFIIFWQLVVRLKWIVINT